MFITLIASRSSFAQDFPNLINSKKVTSITYWDEGDDRSYHFTTIKDTYKNDKDKPTSQEITEYDIHLSVVEAADSFYIMEMVYSNFSFKTGQKKQAIQDEFASLQNGMKIRYKTNHIGQFDTIVNLGQLAQEFEKLITEITDQLVDDLPEEVSKEEFEKLMEFIIKRFTTPENVEILFLSDILTIHGYSGFEFNLDKPEEYEIVYPAFDELELNGKGTIMLTSISKESDSFMININSAPLKGELEKYIKTIFETFSMAMKGKAGEMSDFKITSKSKARYSFELSTGWPTIITETITNTITTKKEKIKTIAKTTVKLN